MVGDIFIEQWKPIVRFAGYCVSNLGRVRSERRMVSYTCKKRVWQRIQYGRFLKQAKDRNGYFFVVLCNQGEKKLSYVHQLVARAFLLSINGELNHKNGIKGDNRAINLEWVSEGENIAHSVNLGLSPHKLTFAEVCEIRKSILTNKELGVGYSVSATTICKIKSGKKWKIKYDWIRRY